MKIRDKELSGAEALQIQKAQSEALARKTGQNPAPAQGTIVSQEDTVSMSSRSLASELAAQIESDSAAKVEKFKKLYQAGELKPADSKTLAEALIQNGSEEVDFLNIISGDENA